MVGLSSLESESRASIHATSNDGASPSGTQGAGRVAYAKSNAWTLPSVLPMYSVVPTIAGLDPNPL